MQETGNQFIDWVTKKVEVNTEKGVEYRDIAYFDFDNMVKYPVLEEGENMRMTLDGTKFIYKT